MRVTVVRLLTIVSLLLSSSSLLAEPKVGDLAPGIQATNQYGQQVYLQQFRGHKYVVLYFYPKDFTSGCTLEAQRFAQDYPKFASRDAVVIGVSRDPVSSHKDFCAKYELPFVLLADPDDKIAKAFGVGDEYGRRSTFLIDKDGRIIYIIGKVTDIPGQDQALLSQLDKAGAGKIGPQVGKTAPDLLLPAQSGNQAWTLATHKGKSVVVLTFYRGWVGYQCPICVRQAKRIDAAADQFAKAGAQLVSVYSGTPQQAAEFLQKAGVRDVPLSPLLVDLHKQAAYAYNVLTADRAEVRPSTFVIDKEGIVRWAYIGKDPQDRPDIQTVLAEARMAAAAASTQGDARR
jgi:peroxiredoxin Q/BCP